MNKLIPTFEIKEDENGNIIEIDKNLAPETSRDIDEIMKTMSNNILFPQLEYIRKISGDNFSLRITNDIYNNYMDIYGIDNIFINIKNDELSLDYLDFQREEIRKTGVKSQCIFLEKNAIYYGCVWVFTNPIKYPQFIGIYGIRSSVINMLNSVKEKGLAKILISAVKQLAIELKCKQIIVPWPLESMVHILNKEGFTEVNTEEQTLQRQFLKPVTITSNYFIYDLC